MLIQFTVENHRSIKNSAVISFAASKDKSFEEYLLHPDEKKTLLPVLAIYGANAAGKSNVLHAMMTMKEMVVGNAAKVSKGQKLPWEPFGGTKVPTSFEIVFNFQGVRYTYGFSFEVRGCCRSTASVAARPARRRRWVWGRSRIPRRSCG